MDLLHIIAFFFIFVMLMSIVLSSVAGILKLRDTDEDIKVNQASLFLIVRAEDNNANGTDDISIIERMTSPLTDAFNKVGDFLMGNVEKFFDAIMGSFDFLIGNAVEFFEAIEKGIDFLIGNAVKFFETISNGIKALLDIFQDVNENIDIIKDAFREMPVFGEFFIWLINALLVLIPIFIILGIIKGIL